MIKHIVKIEKTALGGTEHMYLNGFHLVCFQSCAQRFDSKEQALQAGFNQCQFSKNLRVLGTVEV
jgi:hypothetical protein